MSNNVKLFFEKVNEDENLQEQLICLSDEYREDYTQKILTLAAEQGYEFTQEELKAYDKELLASYVESGELSEEEMETIAGGYFDFSKIFENYMKMLRGAQQSRERG